ncbi:MAG: inositol monophosphatase, partial [archaeon]|nr:inositol monophosphatase [archaeon]
TTNFAHGIDQFCHSVAFQKDGEMVCGAVYNPVQKKLYTAMKGRGAFFNGKKISVSQTEELIDSVIVTGFPYANDELGRKAVNAVASLRGNCQGLRRFGAAALDFCSVAQGVMDGFFEYHLSPWDVAAGMLIVREAGGIVTDINGNFARVDSIHFCASNKKIHDALRSHLEMVD